MRRPLYWMLLIGIPIPALGARWRTRRQRQPARASGGNRPLSLGELVRLANAGQLLDARAVRRSYTGAIGARIGVSPELLTRAGALARVLRRAGVSKQAADDAEQLMRELDAAAYAEGGVLPTDAAQRASTLMEVIDHEALTPGELGPRFRAILSVLICLGLSAGLSIGVVHAARTDDAAARFAGAVRAYQQHDYRAAKQGFSTLALAEPRAVDAWANYGTAAWSLGDTANAVVAWQRALRLEPLASDMRDRVQLAHPLAITSAGYVLPLSLDALFGGAAVCWALCWLTIGLRARGARTWWTAGSLAFVGLSAALLGGGYGFAWTLAGDRATRSMNRAMSTAVRRAIRSMGRNRAKVVERNVIVGERR